MDWKPPCNLHQLVVLAGVVRTRAIVPSDRPLGLRSPSLSLCLCCVRPVHHRPRTVNVRRKQWPGAAVESIHGKRQAATTTAGYVPTRASKSGCRRRTLRRSSGRCGFSTCTAWPVGDFPSRKRIHQQTAKAFVYTHYIFLRKNTDRLVALHQFSTVYVSCSVGGEYLLVTRCSLDWIHTSTH